MCSLLGACQNAFLFKKVLAILMLYHTTSQNGSSSTNGENCQFADFDPNHEKYRCCCNQSHATTGVRIIAGMLCVTVGFELWHLVVTLASGGSGGAILGSLTQLLIGALIAATVICALCKEKAAYLIPYLVLQTVGLAAGAVFLVAFVYISLFGNGDTIIAFIESHGHKVKDISNKQALADTLGYMSWLMVISFACVLALQIWLISIVFACWRFYRDKTAFGCLHGYMSYVVVRPSMHSALAPIRRLNESLVPTLSMDQLKMNNDNEEDEEAGIFFEDRNCNCQQLSKYAYGEQENMSILLKNAIFEKRDGFRMTGGQIFAGGKKPKIVGLYFCARWCPPCRQFTPVLKQFYEQLQLNDDDDFPIICVSFDRSKEEWKTHVNSDAAHGDWYHIVYGDMHNHALAAKYSVSGIPTLVIVKANGDVIKKNGRIDVQQGTKSPTHIFEAWIKKADGV